MEGYKIIKERRESLGYTMRNFAELCGVSFSSLIYYEKGEKLLTSISAGKAIVIFENLKMSPPDFYYEYYPLKEEVYNSIRAWELEHKPDYNFQNLKNRIKWRLSQMKGRGKLSGETFDRIYVMKNNAFEILDGQVDPTGELSKEDYEKYILPIFYLMRRGDSVVDSGTVLGIISDALYHTEYTFKDLALFCGITNQHMNKCKKGVYGWEKLQIGVLLKMCAALSVDFNDLPLTKVKE